MVILALTWALQRNKHSLLKAQKMIRFLSVSLINLTWQSFRRKAESWGIHMNPYQFTIYHNFRYQFQMNTISMNQNPIFFWGKPKQLVIGPLIHARDSIEPILSGLAKSLVYRSSKKISHRHSSFHQNTEKKTFLNE